MAEADEAVHLTTGYLDSAALIAAAQATGAEAIHPGYGFLSENDSFAQACLDAGLVFIGPDPQSILKMGNKAGAKRLMLAAGVPMAVVSKRLGHSSLAITSDTYSHLLEGVGQQAATAAAALVPRGDLRTQNEHSAQSGFASGAGAWGVAAGETGGPPGDRTQNPRIKSPLLCQLS